MQQTFRWHRSTPYEASMSSASGSSCGVRTGLSGSPVQAPSTIESNILQSFYGKLQDWRYRI